MVLHHKYHNLRICVSSPSNLISFNQAWFIVLKASSVRYNLLIFTDIIPNLHDISLPRGHQALGNKRTDWETLMLFCPALMTTLWTLRAQTQNVWLDFGRIFTGVERLTDETRWYGGWKIAQLQIYSRVFHSLYKVRRNGIKGLKEQNKSYLQWALTWCKRLLLV